jgi:hypothetical protein
MRWGGKVCRAFGGLWLLAVVSPIGTPVSHAQEFSAPTSRNFTLDIYQGTAIGSAQIVGMGGVSAATSLGSSGILTNPAAAGVRLTTSNDTWDWDWHFDTQTPGLGSDPDNNGIEEDEELNYERNFTIGFVLQYKDWGAGFSARTQEFQNAFANAMDETLETRVSAETNIGKFSVAHYIFDGQLVLGGGARFVSMKLSSETLNSDEEVVVPAANLATIQGASFETGALWKPRNQSFRVGGTLSLPVIADDIESDGCDDPLDCAGYILPERLKVPWRASVGTAYRYAPTAWNKRVDSDYRDERALLLGVDLVMTGQTEKGYGVEAYGQHQLQPSGRTYSFSLRGGVEYEWFPGKLRVRGGSYFEPSRYKDPEGNKIPGRLHLTVGFDWSFYTLKVWSYKYRLQVSTWADGAEDYGVAGLSVGFWH